MSTRAARTRRRTRVRTAAAALTLSLAVVRVAGAADPCATPAGAVTGTVTAVPGGTPIAAARVRVQGCLGEPVLSDAAGQFTLPVPGGPVVVAAAADGYYVGCWRGGSSDCAEAAAGAGSLAIVLDPLPADDDPAYVFRDSQECAACHQDIFAQWSGSTMAHTNTNRWVDNLYNGSDVTMPPGPPPDPQNPPFFAFLNRHNVDARDPTRKGECANCHQPEYVGPEPTNTSFNAFSRPDQHGVSCEFCHKMVDVDTSPDGIRRPNLVPPKTVMLRSPSEPWLVFGPLDDVTFPGVPNMRASHGVLLRSSRLCAACHEDHADARDANGNFLGTYDGPASQLTYTEWAGSPYAAAGIECQDCHMPPTGADRMCDRTSNVRDPSQVRSHAFEGTTPEFLRRAVQLRARSAVDGQTLAVTVDVTNAGAGHHLPTGVTLRNMILVVDARARDGTRIEQARGSTIPNWGGVGDPEKGSFAGLPGKGYARVLVDEFLVENVLFTEAVDAFDNRIPAKATDTSSYVFQLPKNWAKQDIHVATRLYYRRAFKPIADQRKWNVPLGANAHGTRGDGRDYDENLVVAQVTTRLTCRDRPRKLAVTLDPVHGALTVSATLKSARHVTLDPATNGIQLSLGDPARPNSVLQEFVSGFTTGGGQALDFVGTGTGAVRSLSLTRMGRRAFRMTVSAGDLDPRTLASSKLLLGVDSGEACFRAKLGCKVRGDAVVCR